jgi:hypothetical protein
MVYGFGALIASLIWFFVRIVLEQPTGTPLFNQGTFMFADSLAIIIGLAGIAAIIFDTLGNK